MPLLSRISKVVFKCMVRHHNLFLSEIYRKSNTFEFEHESRWTISLPATVQIDLARLVVRGLSPVEITYRIRIRLGLIG